METTLQSVSGSGLEAQTVIHNRLAELLNKYSHGPDIKLHVVELCLELEQKLNAGVQASSVYLRTIQDEWQRLHQLSPLVEEETEIVLRELKGFMSLLKQELHI